MQLELLLDFDVPLAILLAILHLIRHHACQVILLPLDTVILLTALLSVVTLLRPIPPLTLEALLVGHAVLLRREVVVLLIIFLESVARLLLYKVISIDLVVLVMRLLLLFC